VLCSGGLRHTDEKKGAHGGNMVSPVQNPYVALTRRSGRADTFEDMRFLVLGISTLALIVLVIPTH